MHQPVSPAPHPDLRPHRPDGALYPGRPAGPAECRSPDIPPPLTPAAWAWSCVAAAIWNPLSSGRKTGDPTRRIPVRDQAELALVRSFLAWKRPILGICRGLQVLNVALGGTLIQDLPPERTALHQGGEDVFHPIRTAPGSLLAQCFGPELLVNSAHHQGVDLLGAQLNATAWAPDGTIEALEHTALPAVGVQFHPRAAARAVRHTPRRPTLLLADSPEPVNQLRYPKN